MLHIAILYYSGSGHTKKLASFICEGTREVPNIEVSIIDIETLTEEGLEYLHKAHGIIFGTPTYMGSMAGRFKLFLEETSSLWVKQKWADKIGAGFTIGTSPSGDKLNTLISLSLFAAQQGMVWAGFNHIGSLYTEDNMAINNDGSWLGLMVTSHHDKSQLIRKRDETSAKLFGKRIAEVVKRWHT